MNFLLAVCITLVLIILIIHLVRLMNQNTYTVNDYDDTVETTTTTTTTVTETVAQPTIDQLPTLDRHFHDNGQPYCTDPVDKTVWNLNTNDDMYEDAAGKWWRLVDAKPAQTT